MPHFSSSSSVKDIKSRDEASAFPSGQEDLYESKKNKTRFAKFSRNKRIGLVLVMLIAGGFVYIYVYEKNLFVKKDPQKTAQEEVASIVDQVSKLMVLPEGESPTIATVTDPQALKDQPFFAKATTGDKVLIYTNTRKVILYDPVQHKIIEVAPLNIGQ